MATKEEVQTLIGDLKAELAIIKAKTGYNVNLILDGEQVVVKLSMTSTKTVFSDNRIQFIRYFIQGLANQNLNIIS